MLPPLLLLLLVLALIAWSPVFAFAYWKRSADSGVRGYVWIWAWVSTSFGTVVVLAVMGAAGAFDELLSSV